jgi:DNA-binding CsgD family transcriptional regulator/GAF domain-containing protein
MTIDSTGGLNLAALNSALASAPPGVQSLLSTATSTLTRLVPATWMALVMDPNPETSRVVVADDVDQRMADYVDTYIAAINRPNHAPTVGLSQQVIESGSPMLRKGVSIDELQSMLSSPGQAFMRINPPPGGRRDVDFLMVPIRVGGATIGTLSVADWNHRDVVSEPNIEWVQAAADRIGLSLEHARLAAAVQNDSVRLDLVRSIGLAFRQRQDVGLVTRVVVEQITSSLNVDAADILLLAEGANEMVLQATAGFRFGPAVGNRIPLSVLGVNSAWEPRVEYFSDVNRHGHNPRGTHFAREGFQTLVSVKLHARNRLLGLLELYNRSAVEWDQGWLDFYDTLGVLVGVAIDQTAGATPGASGEKTGLAPRPDLSDLELDILGHIVEGLTNREIAEQVHRSENTIKFHVRRILERTGVSNRTELARRATREGWI